MPLVTNQDHAKSTGTALAYITIGAILSVLAGTSFFFFTTPFEENRVLGYIRTVIFLIGVVLFVIGLVVGHLARVAARNQAVIEEQAAAGTRRQAHGEAQRTAAG